MAEPLKSRWEATFKPAPATVLAIRQSSWPGILAMGAKDGEMNRQTDKQTDGRIKRQTQTFSFFLRLYERLKSLICTNHR